ncbi:MAG TPA: AAA family ATPase [Chloroflexi bacterium]|nr:AAA family ATPase [Chloroflexota bacterium]
MRIPYIVGRWVSAHHHYGRQRLFAYLLDTPDTAIWVVGARRMGKTSLLRQLELLTSQPDSELTPLVWDLQGCETSGDLSAELYLALEDVSERFVALGVNVRDLEGLDALMILRRLTRTLSSQGRRLLLLIDEAEALINVARTEAAWLARLRRALQDPQQKTIIASTKLLVQLNELTTDWPTSPFLFGFNLVNLWSLDQEAAVALIEQRQAERQVYVDATVREEILLHTNRHPYLLQFLCQRLYCEDEAGQGYLRPPVDADLDPDHLLASFFLIDFQHLTRLERRILLAIARRTLTTEQEVLADLADENPQRIRTFLWGLEKLGHVRQLYGQLTVGSEFQRRWMQEEWERLVQMTETLVAEESIEQLLQIGRTLEPASFRAEITRIEQEYDNVRRRLNSSTNGQRADLLSELDRLNRLLLTARTDYEQALARQRH